jgi:hypothetical protein
MTSQELSTAPAPMYGVSAADAATIIRELGMQLIDAYNNAHAKEKGQDGTPSLWGSKQREQLLRGLIARLARHARMFENAALDERKRTRPLRARRVQAWRNPLEARSEADREERGEGHWWVVTAAEAPPAIRPP